MARLLLVISVIGVVVGRVPLAAQQRTPAPTLHPRQVISYDSKTSAVRVVQKADLHGRVVSQFRVNAKGSQAVSQAYGSVAGVLFQATAQPDPRLKSLPIQLAYRLKGEHDAVLVATIGKKEVISDVPAWIWAVAAKFADHDCTGAVTLTDKPPSVVEKTFEQRWRRQNGSRGRLLWAKYHPVVDDTLVGFFLFTADAMMADAEHVRTITDGLKGLEQYSDYSVTLERTKSRRAARALNTIIALESKPGDYAMLNDVDASFGFTAGNGKLTISGVPNYHFAREVRAGVFKEVDHLTAICKKNRRLFIEVNPIVYSTVADFSKLVAFFNFIDKTAPDELDEFVSSLKPVFRRIPSLDIPMAFPLSTPPGRGSR